MAVYDYWYNDAHQRDKYNLNIWGQTDVPAYVEWSTYIDFTHGYHRDYNVGDYYDYTIELEILKTNSSGTKYWSAVELKTGYWRYQVTNRFLLSGKQAGTYRLRGYYTNRKTGANYINTTNPFSVKR